MTFTNLEQANRKSIFPTLTVSLHDGSCFLRITCLCARAVTFKVVHFQWIYARFSVGLHHEIVLAEKK